MATAPLTKFGQIARTRDLGDIVESRGIKLTPGSGRVRQGVCPFHDESEGSFTVYADSQRFHCFGCDEWGDALDFIRKLDSVSVQDAARTLQQQTAAPTRSHYAKPKPYRTPRRDSVIVRAALAYYREILLNAASGQPGRNYLKGRGISRATAEALQLGYCTGNGLKAHLHERGFGNARILRSGLLLDQGRRERFAGMVVIPEILNGSPLWMTGRTVRENVKPRFNALPGRKAILGIGTLPGRMKRLIVAEGVFDWLTLREWGLPSVALAGNGNIDRLVKQLNRVQAGEVVLALDANEKGESLTRRLLGLDPGDGDEPRAALANASSVSLPGGYEDIGELATVPDGKTRFMAALG